MGIQKNIEIDGKHGRPILTDVLWSNEAPIKTVIVFCHGYKGFKDWGAWNQMGEQFMQMGYCFVKFNFSFNGGTVEQPIDFPDLNAFGNNNYSIELDDLKVVLDWIETSLQNKIRASDPKLFLMGHSRGGGICAIKSEEDERIDGLITLASVSDFKKRFNEGSEEFETWKQTGVKYVLNGRTKQDMPHFFQT